jgi:hypothetical protein
MLQHQIETMRSVVDRALLRIHPPAELIILQEHADFLGVKYDLPKRKELSAIEAMQRQAAKAMLPGGKPYGPLIRVKLDRLYVALRNAKGVNHPEYRSREDQTQDENYSQASAETEN